ncbi:gluconate permease [Marispirochaeta aestuarii]|uniref:Gluconate permease n=1 Tax=Marispirochaeta aestuarii TaxID=1963862 RepID=A0A1Y1RYB0_9SPIO|nr:gluconate:H+ symporter [Marispirochaeta aestuarii]ORC35448.1 gluconate permease [Marispirochaeta aestuarii]
MVTGPLLLVIFIVAIAFVLLAILAFRMNPFIVLLLSGVLTGFLVGMPIDQIGGTLASGFGGTLSGIGIVIGLGIVLGQILAEANATDQIAHTLVNKVGDKRSPLAINFAGYLVSIPVFFDAAFVIFEPLIRRLSQRTRIPFITYVTALAVGLIVTHAIVIPTPGPIAVAGNMGADFGLFLLYSLIVSIPSAVIGGYLFGTFLGKRAKNNVIPEEEVALKNTDNRPSAGLSISVLLLPIVLILLGSIMKMVLRGDGPVLTFFGFIGDKNIALLIGVIVAMLALKKYIPRSIDEVIVTAVGSAGMIFLITGAGGSFGNVIKSTGIGDYLVEIFTNVNMPLIVLGFVLSQILRSSLGSTTVALVTTSTILGPVAASMGVSPILVGLAICAGGVGLSLPNDSGFWVVSRYANISVQDTLKSWTAGGTIAGVTALVIILILSLFSGILPGLA